MERSEFEAARELKLGGTYQHYKTRGLYTPLQLVSCEVITADAHLKRHLSPVTVVTFTGDGPHEDKMLSLYYSLSENRLVLSAPSDVALEGMQVLYYSQQHTRYFVRPLTEFVATIGNGSVSAPVRLRFELQK